MTEIWITGMGLCSALGTTLAQSWSALLQGKSGIVLQQPFDKLPPYPLAMIAATPAALSQLLDNAVTDILSTGQAYSVSHGRCGVVVGSSRGYQAELEGLAHQWHRDHALPTAPDWAWIYGQSPAARVAQMMQISGPVLAPRAACATGLWAIAQGAELIRTGQCDAVISGAVDAPITPLTLAGFQQMGALARDGAYPFDQRRTGFVLGEGAGLLLLERRDIAEQRGAQPYGKILGVGLTSDAYHISAPAPDRKQAIAAIQACLERSHLAPHQVDYIHAHGTGTHLNDETEASLIQALFSAHIAVSSTKGATGHTLGASGAIGAIFCLMALHQQILPPCTGLQQPAYPLNLVSSALSTPVRAALCFSFGFGGQNAALAFAQTQF